MRVLVTGGAGFIGSHVLQHAQAAGFDVAGLDNFSTGKRQNVPAGVQVYTVDLRDREATLRAVSDFRPDVVSHHAAQASVSVSVKDPRFDAEVNIIGGLNLLDACTAAGSKVSHLVFASTGGAIYGEVPEGQRASESYVLEPKSPYGISKLTFERLLRVYREERGLRSTVLRYSNVYGPRQDPHGEAGVVAIFFAAALGGGPLRVNVRREAGDGGCIRDYVFVADVARANLLALTDKLGHDVLNVCSGTPTSTLALAEHITRLAGQGARLEPGPPRAGDLARSLLDPSRFEAAVGPITPLDQGLEETASFYRAR